MTRRGIMEGGEEEKRSGDLECDGMRGSRLLGVGGNGTRRRGFM